LTSLRYGVEFDTNVSTTFERIKRWFHRAVGSVEEAVQGGSPAATPPPGANRVGMGDTERETSTNAQTEGAADEPWSGNT
jgi:hypothetical protein